MRGLPPGPGRNGDGTPLPHSREHGGVQPPRPLSLSFWGVPGALAGAESTSRTLPVPNPPSAGVCSRPPSSGGVPGSVGLVAGPVVAALGCGQLVTGVEQEEAGHQHPDPVQPHEIAPKIEGPGVTVGPARPGLGGEVQNVPVELPWEGTRDRSGVALGTSSVTLLGGFGDGRQLRGGGQGWGHLGWVGMGTLRVGADRVGDTWGGTGMGTLGLEQGWGHRAPQGRGSRPYRGTR